MEALEHINALTLVFVALCVFAIAYRFYGIFLANKVLRLDGSRPTPAVPLCRRPRLCQDQ